MTRPTQRRSRRDRGNVGRQPTRRRQSGIALSAALILVGLLLAVVLSGTLARTADQLGRWFASPASAEPAPTI